MKGFDVLKVKSAVKNHNKFDLSRTHLTTLDFGEIMPMFVEETVPGDKFSIDANYFSRMAPLVKPTYGKFSYKTVAAFVPYHQLAYDFDAWVAGKTSFEGSTPVLRNVSMFGIHKFVDSYCTTTTNATSANTDYTYIDSSGNVVYKVFTAVGKYYVKVLNALGYALSQGVDLQTGSTWYTSTRDTVMSAMPLLAFFKLYNDYMSQSQRFNSSSLSSVLQNIKYNKAITNLYTSGTGNLNYNCIKSLFDGLFLNYENDYFTSAWQNANGALASQDGILTAQAPGYTSPDGVATHNLVDTKISVTGNSSSVFTAQIGQRALDFLKDFDDWVRRNNYSGSRAVQQIYSRFGIKTDDYKSHYANVISTDSMPVQVGDVTATGPAKIDGTEVGLGDYSGKGIMNGGKNVSVQVSDYGLILILGYFTVAPMNSFGSDRRVLRSSPLDFYTPEFDGLGADAISVGELWASPISTSSTVADDEVFGFTERYNSYRYGRDVITGEFRNYHADGDMNCWHTGRNLADIRDAGNLVAQSTAMNTLPQSDSEYNRIFSITNGPENHFYMTAQFKVSAIRPMLNLNQVVRLGEGDTNVPRNGNVIS